MFPWAIRGPAGALLRPPGKTKPEAAGGSPRNRRGALFCAAPCRVFRKDNAVKKAIPLVVIVSAAWACQAGPGDSAQTTVPEAGAGKTFADEAARPAEAALEQDLNKVQVEPLAEERDAAADEASAPPTARRAEPRPAKGARERERESPDSRLPAATRQRLVDYFAAAGVAAPEAFTSELSFDEAALWTSYLNALSDGDALTAAALENRLLRLHPEGSWLLGPGAVRDRPAYGRLGSGFAAPRAVRPGTLHRQPQRRPRPPSPGERKGTVYLEDGTRIQEYPSGMRIIGRP